MVPDKERGTGAVRKDEPLGKPCSLVASAVALDKSANVCVRRGASNSLSSAVSMSVFSGFGCAMVSSSLACRRSARAFSTGPKTRARNLVWLAFLLLARALLAMLGVESGGSRGAWESRLVSCACAKRRAGINFAVANAGGSAVDAGPCPRVRLVTLALRRAAGHGQAARAARSTSTPARSHGGLD